MKKTFLAALCAVAAACGGGDDSVDPSKAQFTYGSSTPVSTGSDAYYAADTGTSTLSDALVLRDTTDPTTADTQTSSVVGLADNVASEALGSTLGSSTYAARAQAVARRALAVGLGASAAVYTDPGCVTVTPGRISYASCTESYSDGTSTETFTVNGSLTRAISGDVETLSWDFDLKTTMADSDTGATWTLTSALTGSLAIDAATIRGQTRSDHDVRVSVPGQSLSLAFSHLADVDLQYLTSPAFCLSGGTLEVRRVWTKRPSVMDPSEMQDAAALLTFGPGCGAVSVAWGTR